MFNTRKINNALILSFTNANMEYEENAFPFSDPDWAINAKAFVSANKAVVSDSIESQAFDRIDDVEAELLS